MWRCSLASSASSGSSGTSSPLGPHRPSPLESSHLGGKNIPSEPGSEDPTGIPAGGLLAAKLGLGLLASAGREGRVRNQLGTAPPRAPWAGGLVFGGSPQAEQLVGKEDERGEDGLGEEGWGYSQNSLEGAAGVCFLVALDLFRRDSLVFEHFLGAALGSGAY